MMPAPIYYDTEKDKRIIGREIYDRLRRIMMPKPIYYDTEKEKSIIGREFYDRLRRTMVAAPISYDTEKDKRAVWPARPRCSFSPTRTRRTKRENRGKRGKENKGKNRTGKRRRRKRTRGKNRTRKEKHKTKHDRITLSIHFMNGNSRFHNRIKNPHFNHYKILNSSKMDETFFPVTWRKNKKIFFKDKYLRKN